MDEYNIIVAGVGGQGVLFLSGVLGKAALKSGFNVRVAEIHGMAQRGGSVICHVRIGSKVFSPTIVEGEAHLLIALEPIEALRHLKYANSETLMVVSTNTVKPPGLYMSNERYPNLKEVYGKLREASTHLLTIDTLDLARKAGSPATQNTVLLGVTSASGRLPVSTSLLKEAVASSAKKFKQVNVKAFDLGFESYDKTLKPHSSTMDAP